MAGRVFVIVGASLAGAKAAQGLREAGFDGRIVMIGEEPSLPYARPELSKGYLLGGKVMADLLVHPAGFYAEHDIEVRTATAVTGIDRATSQVRISGGESLAYDRLLLTTGASPRALDIPGVDLPGVVSLRTLADADALRERIAQGGRVVVVGAGWIGCEVAACARMRGAQVTMLTPDAFPLVRVLGAAVGAVFADLHTQHGVDLRLGTGVAEVVGTDRAEGVRTTDGETISGDLIVIGVGAAPRDELARQAGLEVDNGILVTEFLTTSDPRIYAAGMLPTRGTRFWVPGCGWSTGTTPSSRAWPRPPPCSAPPWRSLSCRSSTPTSTSSAWSTGGMPPPGTRWCSAGIRLPGSSSRSGCTRAGSWRR